MDATSAAAIDLRAGAVIPGKYVISLLPPDALHRDKVCCEPSMPSDAHMRCFWATTPPMSRPLRSPQSSVSWESGSGIVLHPLPACI